MGIGLSVKVSSLLVLKWKERVLMLWLCYCHLYAVVRFPLSLVSSCRIAVLVASPSCRIALLVISLSGRSAFCVASYFSSLRTFREDAFPLYGEKPLSFERKISLVPAVEIFIVSIFFEWSVMLSVKQQCICASAFVLTVIA